MIKISKYSGILVENNKAEILLRVEGSEGHHNGSHQHGRWRSAQAGYQSIRHRTL